MFIYEFEVGEGGVKIAEFLVCVVIGQTQHPWQEVRVQIGKISVALWLRIFFWNKICNKTFSIKGLKGHCVSQ